MAQNPYTATTFWSADARYTAGADVDILLSNASGQHTLLWIITTTDTVPTSPVASGNPIKPDSSRAMQLLSGERLWLATRSNEVPANVEGAASA